MLVEINDLVKRYGDLLAVDHVSEIREGEILGLLWPEWGGKTTTLNMLLGLTRIDGDHQDLRAAVRRKRRADQEADRDRAAGDRHLRRFDGCGERVLFGRLYDLQGALLRERVHEALSFAWLEEKKNQFPRKFSGE